MKRLVDAKLTSWKERPNRKPLVLRGARQVGKTWSIMEFATRNFRNTIVLNFEKDRKLHTLFGDDLSARNLAMLIEAYTGQSVRPGETILFLDEIQACPRALMALRYFYEEMPELHVIAAGSLLEFAVENISFPVGRVEFEWLNPLSFEEFLWAMNLEELASHLPSLQNPFPVPEALHTKLLEQVRIYSVVGGLPEPVAQFAGNRSLAETSRIHDNLYTAYLQDFVKYAPRVNRDCLQQTFEGIARMVGTQVKYSCLDPDRRVETVKNCLRVLERACVLRLVRSTPAQGLPLGAASSAKIFKAVFLDTGLMQHINGLPAADILASRDVLDIYRGSVAEQFVGQQILAAGGSENHRLYYWRRAAKNSAAEMDYVLVREGEIIPVEVKSGSAGRLKSLQVFLAEHPQCRRALVLSSGNVRTERNGKMLFLPLYSRLA